MPLYQQIILTLPKLPKEALVNIFRKHTKTVLDNKGNVRGIENHGVRALPERTRRKYAVTDGSRYFWEARYVSTTFDASPNCLIEIDRMLRNEEGVLRAFTVKHKSSLFRCSSKNYKNPFFEPPAASEERPL